MHKGGFELVFVVDVVVVRLVDRVVETVALL